MYWVIADRTRHQVVTQGGNIYLPFGHEGALWESLYWPGMASPTGNVTDEAQDVIDFATAIFHLDKLCPRGARENWVRTINLQIALRNPARFQQIADDMALALSILGADNFTFQITQLNGNRDIVRDEPDDRVERWGRVNEIALLSGGQDSFVGAAKLLNDGRNPLFVRVHSSDRSNLKELRSILRTEFEIDPNVFIQKPGSIHIDGFETEKSQRLRSFYFLCVASVVAHSHNVGRVHINENGIMAVHLPLDAARGSTFSTRTAYPFFLSTFSNVISRWLGRPIAVTNAFETKTKAEVIELGADLNVNSGITRAVSCAHAAVIQRTVKRHRSKDYLMAATAPDFHCGYCFPCLLRRISMWSSGLADEDVTYATDPFKVFVDGSADDLQFVYEASSAVLGLIRFVRKFQEMETEELVSDFPQIVEAGEFLRSGDSDEIIAFHKKFAEEVITYIREEASFLTFMLNSNLAEEMERKVNRIASNTALQNVLRSAGVIQTTEAFDTELDKLFYTVRLRIQVALATTKMTEAQMRSLLTRELRSIANSRKRDGKNTLSRNEASELKKGIWRRIRDRDCDPLW